MAKHPDHSGRSLDSRVSRSHGDPTGRGQDSNPRTDGQSGCREPLPACFPLGSRAGGLRPEGQPSWLPGQPGSSARAVFVFLRLPRAGYHLLLWLPGERLAIDDELWKLSGKVGQRGDPQVGSAREESLAEEGGSTFTHSPACGMGESWERLCRRQEYQLIPCSFIPACSLPSFIGSNIQGF